MDQSAALNVVLAQTRTIHLTTIGRNSGRPRRIEIWWFHIEGRFIVTGTPGTRDWLANVRVNPNVVIHAAGHDLAAVASEVNDREFRRRVFTDSTTRWYRSMAELDELISKAPMVEIDFGGPAAIP